MVLISPSGSGVTAEQAALLEVLLEGFDAESETLAARFIPTTGTDDEINLLAGEAGELAVDTTNGSLRLFDGVTNGGRAVGLESGHCRYLAAVRTPAQSGAALYDALAEIQALTPGGSAVSTSNPVTLIPGPGVWDLRGGGGDYQLITSGVRIVGLGGSQAVRLLCDNTHRIGLVVAVDENGLIVSAGSCLDHALIGLTLQSVQSTPSSSMEFTIGQVVWDSSATPIRLWHQDLDFPGLTSSQSAMAWTAANHIDAFGFSGSAIRCRTTGRALYGGWVVGLGPTWAVRFEDCEAGDRSFGGSGTTQGTTDGTVTGGIFRCRNFGTTWRAKLNGDFVGNHWTPPIERLGSSAYLRHSRIDGTDGSGDSVSHNEAVNARIAHCLLKGAIDANVTNQLSATLDGAGNVVDSDA